MDKANHPISSFSGVFCCALSTIFCFVLLSACATTNITATAKRSFSDLTQFTDAQNNTLVARIAVGSIANNSKDFKGFDKDQPDGDTLVDELSEEERLQSMQKSLAVFERRYRLWEKQVQQFGHEVAGPRPALSYVFHQVLDFARRQNGLSQIMQDMLSSLLEQSGHFDVVERIAFSSIVSEQEVRGQNIDQFDDVQGELLGADLILTGGITMVEEEASGGAMGLILSAVLNAALANAETDVNIEEVDFQHTWKTTKVSFDLRIVDVQTSRVISTTAIEGTSTDDQSQLAFKIEGIPVNFDRHKNVSLEETISTMLEPAIVDLISKIPADYYRYPAQIDPLDFDNVDFNTPD